MYYKVRRWRKTRFWSVTDLSGNLVCVCAYRIGALELAARLDRLEAPR